MTAPESLADLLVEAVSGRCRPAPGDWYSRALPTAEGGLDRSRFLAAFAGASRRLKATTISLDPATSDQLEAAGVVAPSDWDAAQVVRASLLASAMESLGPAEGYDLAREVFERGDNREKISFLVTLCALPRCESLCDIAVEACRTNVQDVFEAIACENRYPATYFSEGAFNQMTVKALFTGIRLERIVGLAQRRNPELARMVGDYVAERRAAGRPVPEDAALVMDPGQQ